jgi:hypothetical protein
MTPIRIQRKRTRGWRMPAHTKSVTRPGKFGNPYSVVKDARGWAALLNGKSIGVYFYYKFLANRYAVDKFREHVMKMSDLDLLLAELRGWNLACWCPIDSPCHADVWIELANKDEAQA